MMKLVIDFLLSGIASMGFAIFFNIPRRVIPMVGITGGSGWVLSIIIQKLEVSSNWAYFAAAVLVSFLAEIFARKTHNPSTLFSIPGIYPLVPGYGLYSTMYYFTRGEVNLGVVSLLQTLSAAGAIAVGIITMSSFWTIMKKRRADKERTKKEQYEKEHNEDSLDKMFE